MWRSVICASLLAFGCTRTDRQEEVALPMVAPDTAVVSWSVISRSPDRRSTHVVLDSSRDLVVTTRSSNGTMMTVSHRVPEEDYLRLIGTIRTLDCCSLSSTSEERSRLEEAKPELEINFGDVRCEVVLWDREWREGRARECGFAFARLHGSGFVPDPPVDEASP
jgi:hypothetical protein